MALAFAAVSVTVLIRENNADQRAERLLRSHLSADELRQLNQLHYLDVPSRAYTDRVYRIPAHGGTVAVIERGTTTMRACLLPAQQLPGREEVLAHKVFLEADEHDYLRRANVMCLNAKARLPQIGG